jgi:hypothetical protein
MSEINLHGSDLVLGGENPPPITAAILGGLAGVKQRLASESIANRTQALTDSVQYGEKAIELALQALTDESYEIQHLASKLLRYQFGTAGEEALWEHASSKIHIYYNPLYQSRLNKKIYDFKTEISNPEDLTYIVQISNLAKDKNDVSNLDRLIKDPNIDSLRSLIVELSSLLDSGIYSSKLFEEVMHPILMRNVAPNLKSLAIAYKFRGNVYKIDKELIRKEMDDLYDMILSSFIISQGLKFLGLDIATSAYGEYFSAEKISKMENTEDKKASINFITNMKVS